MTLAKNLYNTLVEILEDVRELPMGAGLLQADHAIALRFGVSESTARNWRRGKHSQLAPATMAAIIKVCNRIAPERVSDLEFIERLSRGAHEARLAADALVEQLNNQIHSKNTTWHIYSGPLKMAFDLKLDPMRRQRLMTQSSLIVRRVLEMGIDQANIPAAPELIRYSTHGWYLNGLFKIREDSLQSELAGILDGYLSPVEAALYVGDGCAVPSLISGNPERAGYYAQQALNLLQTATIEDEQFAAVSIHDAATMIRSIQVMIACHSGYRQQEGMIAQFVHDHGDTPAQIEWIEGHRQEALGYIELAKRVDFPKAAHHFAEAGKALNKWLSQFDIPFSSTASQSLCGYALLMSEGPTEPVRSQISEGLLRTIDLGIVSHQIRARLCQARLYESSGDRHMAAFQHEKTQELVQRHNLQRWYTMLDQMLLPINA
ncbi:MAG: hypothetical protein U0528_20705 [Anaerolineae bacterium]|nr:hypothetical protein [Anaerolineae bacterium]